MPSSSAVDRERLKLADGQEILDLVVIGLQQGGGVDGSSSCVGRRPSWPALHGQNGDASARLITAVSRLTNAPGGYWPVGERPRHPPGEGPGRWRPSSASTPICCPCTCRRLDTKPATHVARGPFVGP